MKEPNLDTLVKSNLPKEGQTCLMMQGGTEDSHYSEGLCTIKEVLVSNIPNEISIKFLPEKISIRFRERSSETYSWYDVVASHNSLVPKYKNIKNIPYSKFTHGYKYTESPEDHDAWHEA